MNKNISLPPISDIFQSGMPDPFAPKPYYAYPSPYYSYEYQTQQPRGVYAYKHEPMLLHHKYTTLPYYHASPRGLVSSNESGTLSESTPRAVSPSMSHATTRAKTRNNLPKETTYILLKWLNEHLSHPYPNSFEKTQLMVSTGLNQQQLSNWFINARRRKIKNLKQNQADKLA